MTKEIVIDGNNFSTLTGFYDEVERKLTKGLSWKIGRNLDALNDVLAGGFGVYESDEPVEIKWIDSAKSMADLGDVFNTLVEIMGAHKNIKLTVE